MKSSLQLISIDFTKPWWYLILKQKWLALSVLISIILQSLFLTLSPFLITLVLEKSSWSLFILTCAIASLSELNSIAQFFGNIRLQLQCIHSIYFNAHHYLLGIDPHCHIKRSSGTLLAKIERAARGYERILDELTFEFIPLLVGTITMFIVLSYYSLVLTLIIAFCLTLMAGYGYYFARYACQEWENAFIKSDDEYNATAFENLAQVHLIRATFASDYMQKKLTEKVYANAETEKKLWLSYALAARILSCIYALSILVLLGFLLQRVNAQIVSVPFAISLILAYIQSTRYLLKIIQTLRKYMRGYAAIKDLFAFIPNFGKQTFPVFKSEHTSPKPNKKKHILAAENIYFSYAQADIFNNHSLQINADNHSNKLFGIIGPSGIGKTTLISILGGQLKPMRGTVTINGIDIYNVSDGIRKQLIALQGQIATTIKGTIRYNLLFGLPENHGYSDEYLTEIIKRVGLEPVLREHQGLETQLGEGALNISGGQRQRLNFAALYLRARFYKPILILIDEPTSSLDEISEQAITVMIQELATSAITLVIAHRLKTLKDAAGLIDLSLLDQSNKISVYRPEELKKQSVYYQQLLEGKYELN